MVTSSSGSYTAVDTEVNMTSDTGTEDEDELFNSLATKNAMAKKSSGRKTFTIDSMLDSNARISKRQKTIVGIFFGFVVAVVVVLTIALSTKGGRDFMNHALTTKRQVRDRTISLADAVSAKFRSQSFDVTWVSDDEYLRTINEETFRVKIDENGEETTRKRILSKEEWLKYTNTNKFSADGRYLLLEKNKAPLYRYSYFADFFIKDLERDIVQPVLPPDYGSDQYTKIRHCEWSKEGNGMAIVYKNNIYYLPTVLLEGENGRVYYQITKDGVDKQIFNGVPDWVYEEEILNAGYAMEFSGTGRYLVYGKFDATQVRYFKFPMYEAQSEAYTSIQEIAYPKAGSANPTVQLIVADLNPIITQSNVNGMRVDVTHSKIIPPEEITRDTEKYGYYYGLFSWTKEFVYVQWMNRHQNRTISTVYDAENPQKAANGQHTIIGANMEHHITKEGWIDDDYVTPYFSKDGSYYITMLPNKGWRHISQVHMNSVYENGRITAKRGDPKFITEGDFWIHDLKCYDDEKEIIYYRSTKESPRRRQVYAYDIQAKSERCITCNVKDETSPVADCTYWYPQFSKKCKWVTLMCQGPADYQYTSLLNTKTNKYQVKEANGYLQNTLKDYDIPHKIFYEVESDEKIEVPDPERQNKTIWKAKYMIHVSELRPRNFDPNKKYAVLFDVYGGPNTQKVVEMQGIHMSAHLVSSYPTIVVNVDARGSTSYGYRYLYGVYRQLGHAEATDILTVGRYLTGVVGDENKPGQSYVDRDRMAIWGWSYGGFLSATVLSFPTNDVFTTGISVAPVSDWRYYDTVYAERYMGLPTKEDNLKGYEESSIMSRVNNLIPPRFEDREAHCSDKQCDAKWQAKNFLLIHGTGDDNVHFQNSAQLSKKLIEAGVNFRQQYYPDKRHSIATNHIWKVLSRYLVSHLFKDMVTAGKDDMDAPFD